ncbi:uncharacterized protein LOC114528477 [Dendronephthya gigantea]|uniref:uncharacterized protein LOC114528477 n=1 Tax=Dendronephthya gigantea TaxID=151771 RepID=UPI0010697494|nr:uncharacterized protein LOC114528477 [Dendronephthya gigantea]
MSKASPSNMAAGIAALLVFIVKLILNYLSGGGKGPFPRSNTNVSNVFYLEITPAGWAFSIWGVIYTLNGGYIIYGLSTLFRDFPAIFSVKFFLSCIVSDAFNIAWLFAFSYLEIGWSCAAIISYTLGLYTVLAIIYKNYQSHKKELETRFSKDAWAIRILAQNGAMMNATWVSIATLLNVAMVMHYKWDVDLSLSCNIVLAILLVELVIWFSLENFSKLQSPLNYSYTDWPVVLWALSASLAKNYDPSLTSSKFTLALLIISVIAFIVRVALQIVRNHISSYTTV